MTISQSVEKFINGFKQYDKENAVVITFTCGYCYWFAVILSNRFRGEIFYEPVEGHFITNIMDDLYDITGNVTEKYWNKALYDKDTYMDIKNVVSGCINKTD